MKKINCGSCNVEHDESLFNCSFINCKCGKTICGSCGSTDIGSVPESQLDLSEYSDDQYWCQRRCNKCGHTGCGMCI